MEYTVWPQHYVANRYENNINDCVAKLHANLMATELITDANIVVGSRADSSGLKGALPAAFSNEPSVAVIVVNKTLCDTDTSDVFDTFLWHRVLNDIQPSECTHCG